MFVGSRIGRRPLGKAALGDRGPPPRRFAPVLRAAPSLERAPARANQRDGEQGLDDRRKHERRDARGERLLRTNELGEPQKAKDEYDGVSETQRPEEPDPGAVPPPVGGKADYRSRGEESYEKSSGWPRHVDRSGDRAREDRKARQTLDQIERDRGGREPRA